MKTLSLSSLYGQLFSIAVTPRMDTSTTVEVTEVAEADVLDLVSDGDVSYLLESDFLLPCSLGDFSFKVEPLIRVSGSNSIVKTKVANLPGTVKEHISEDDLKITLRGILINKADELPTDQVKALRKELKRQEAIPINNALLRAFGVTKVVVDNYVFPDEEGVQNAQSYILELTSDNEHDLVLA